MVGLEDEDEKVHRDQLKQNLYIKYQENKNKTCMMMIPSFRPWTFWHPWQRQLPLHPTPAYIYIYIYSQKYMIML